MASSVGKDQATCVVKYEKAGRILSSLLVLLLDKEVFTDLQELENCFK